MKSNSKPKQSDQPIQAFQAYYQFLSNDFPTWIYFQGILYPSITTAYQAARTDDQQIRNKISNTSDVQEFAKLCLSIKNPEDWKSRKYKIMEQLTRDKFKRNKQLANKLMGTKNRSLINSMKKSGYNEQYWGVYNQRGSNMLGKILTTIRSEIANSTDTKQWILNSLNLQSDQKLWPVANILVTKDDKKIDKLFLQNKNYFIFGSLKSNDFILENPTISRNHACLYFNSDIQLMIVDLNSTHGTFVTKSSDQKKIRLDNLIPYNLEKGDILQFGTSIRQYTIQELDRDQVEQYIAQTQANLKKELSEVIQSNKVLEDYQNIKKEDIKSALGINCPCLLAKDLDKTMSYQNIKEKFEQYGPVKKLKTKVDKKTGKFIGTAVIYFGDSQTAKNVVAKERQMPLKVISEQEAEIYLGNLPDRRRKESPKRQKRYQRSRSREKKRRG